MRQFTNETGTFDQYTVTEFANAVILSENDLDGVVSEVEIPRDALPEVIAKLQALL